MYKNRVYLASPFFSPEQKARIEKVVAALKQNPTIDPDGIYNPQEHQEESLEFGSRDWQDSVFNTDMRLIISMKRATTNPTAGQSLKSGRLGPGTSPSSWCNSIPTMN